VEPSVLEEVLVVQRLLRKQIPSGVRWTQPEQMHLTLCFLGEVEESRLDELSAALEEAVVGGSAFDLRLEGCGVFPERGRPRVLWVGLDGDLEALQALQRRVVEAVGSWGSHRETKPFHPHLTLGRVRPDADLGEATVTLLQDAEGPRSIQWRVREVSLMSSDLTPSGARYTVIRSAALS